MNSEKQLKQKLYFQEWYAKNKEKLRKSRRKRYMEDEEYRNKVRSHSAEWRRTHPAPVRAPARSKVLNGVEVTAFRISEAAGQVGRSDQTIRDWEEKGIIPKPTIDKAHRFYTLGQIGLMKGLADLIDVLRYAGRGELAEAVACKSQEIHKCWND